MNILYYDCFFGISGDMNLAAMIGLGVDPKYLSRELSKLNIGDEFSLEVSADERKGIHGNRVDVVLKHDAHFHHHHGDHDHNHDHIHKHKHHHPRHVHRNLKDIEKIINSSDPFCFVQC